MTTVPIQTFFPLYDLAYDQIKDRPNLNTVLSDQEILDLKSKLESLDKIGTDMIYVFMRVHSIRTSSATRIMDVPYAGEVVSSRTVGTDQVNDVKFDLRNLPPFLCRMLDHFATLHLRRAGEEQKRLSHAKV